VRSTFGDRLKGLGKDLNKGGQGVIGLAADEEDDEFEDEVRSFLLSLFVLSDRTLTLLSPCCTGLSVGGRGGLVIFSFLVDSAAFVVTLSFRPQPSLLSSRHCEEKIRVESKHRDACAACRFFLSAACSRSSSSLPSAVSKYKASRMEHAAGCCRHSEPRTLLRRTTRKLGTFRQIGSRFLCLTSSPFPPKQLLTTVGRSAREAARRVAGVRQCGGDEGSKSRET
jgi:hypothetical protein